MNNSHKNKIRFERRSKERLNRRVAILKAARKVFFKKGLMAATVDEIAGRCGLAKGTIYLYFKSKEEIYVSLMHEGTNLLKREMEKVKGLNLQSDKLLEMLLNIYYGFYKKNREYFRIIFLSSHPDIKANVPDELIQNCMESGRGCLLIIDEVIKKGIERGFFTKVDTWAVANILWAAVNGIIMIYEQDERHSDELVGIKLEGLLKKSLTLFLKGLKVRK